MRTIEIDAVDHSGLIRQDSIAIVEAAYGGEVGIGGFNRDDYSLDDVPAMKLVTIEEDEATPTRMFTGYTSARELERGKLAKQANLRQWDVELLDLNTILDDEVFQISGANRPAETDYARVTWLLTTPAIDALGITAGVVPNTNTVNMEARDYRGAGPRDVLDDCGAQAGKNYFIYNYGSGSLLYYDKATGTSLTSPLTLSTVLSDVDDSTCFALINPKLVLDPTRIYSAVDFRYEGGHVYVSDQDIADEFRRREIRIEDSTVTSAATATARANAYLAVTASEKRRFTASVSVPNANVNDIRAGQRIQVKVPHLEISSFTYMRISRRVVTVQSDERYLIALEFAEDLLPLRYGGGGGTPNTGNCSDCTRIVAALPTSMTSDLSMASAASAMHVYDGTTLTRYNCALHRTHEVTPAVGDIPIIYREPVDSTLLTGDKGYYGDPGDGSYGSTRWSEDIPVTALAPMDATYFWAVVGGTASPALHDYFNRTIAPIADGGDIGATQEGDDWTAHVNDTSATPQDLPGGDNPDYYGDGLAVLEVDGDRLHYQSEGTPYGGSQSEAWILHPDSLGTLFGSSDLIATFDLELVSGGGSGGIQGGGTFQFLMGPAKVQFYIDHAMTNVNVQLLGDGNPFTSIGDVYNVHVKVRKQSSSPRISVKVWAVGDDEPGSWLLTNDNLSGSIVELFFSYWGDAWVNNLVIIPAAASDYELQKRLGSDGSLIDSVGLDNSTTQIRRMPEGEHVYVATSDLAMPMVLEKYSKTLVLEDTITLSGYGSPEDETILDWNVDDSGLIYVYLGNQKLYVFDVNGGYAFDSGTHAEFHDKYRFPPMQTYPGGTGQTVFTTSDDTKPVLLAGYSGKNGDDAPADWLDGSDAVVVTFNAWSGVFVFKRLGTDADAGQAAALSRGPGGNCLWCVGLSDGSTFEGKAIDGPWIVKGV